MKIWIQDIITPTYRLIKFNCEEHSNYEYKGDFTDDEFREYLLELKDDIDTDKNIKLLKYYGYLHLFIVIKKNNS